MSGVRIAYIFSICFFQLFCLVLAIITPVYFTVGYYWWSAFCIFLIFSSGHSFGIRVNSWGILGKIEIEDA